MYNGNNDNHVNGPLSAPSEKETFEESHSGKAINKSHENIIESDKISDNYRQEDDIRRDFSSNDNIAPPPKSGKLNKSNGGAKYFLSMLFIVALIICACYIFNPFGIGDYLVNTAEKIKNDPSFSLFNGVSDQFEENYNGHFTYEDNNAYVYALDDNSLFFYIKNNAGYASGIAKTERNKQSASVNVDNDKYSFSIAKDGLLIKTSSSIIASATYEKEENITREKCFMLDYNAKKYYLDSKYNGTFELGSTSITLFQITDNEVHCYINSFSGLRGLILNIQKDGTLKTSAAMEKDSSESIRMIVKKMSLSVGHTPSGGDDLSGEYTKTKEIDVDTILKQDF